MIVNGRWAMARLEGAILSRFGRGQGVRRAGWVRLALAVLLLPAALSGCGLAPGSDSAPAGAAVVEQPPYQLGAGDKIRITVYGEKELTGEYQVDGAGQAALPLVGLVPVGGLTLEEAAKRVAAAYRNGYLKDPQISVEVLNYRPFYILGEVKNPGSYPYVNGMTVLNAVALAGGYTYRAEEDSVLIVRAKDPQKREVAISPDSSVLPGDIVKVKERYF